MFEFVKILKKDLGLEKEVLESYPTDVVGDVYDGSLTAPIAAGGYATILNHVVPAGHQLKIMQMRIGTQSVNGVRFRIFQTNPTAAGQTGSVEAYKVVGKTPTGTRDVPFLEAAGAEVLRGGFDIPVEVLEGSIEFRILGATENPATGSRYIFSWWGVERTPPPEVG